MTGMRIHEEIAIDGRSLIILAGPCVIESEELCLDIADSLSKIRDRLDLPCIFKASFDKANRTGMHSFRGPGLERGLEILQSVKSTTGMPVITDIHLPHQAAEAAAVADLLQIPAFLCRQTDLVIAAAETGRPVLIKKGQFMAPHDMQAVIEKAAAVGNDRILLCERGSCFGYNELVVDMRSIPRMKALGKPVIFDMTHSTQKPGALGGSSGGDSELALPLGLAAVAAGADGVFIETHPEPGKALSDSSTMLALSRLPDAVGQLKKIFEAAVTVEEPAKSADPRGRSSQR